MPIDRAWTRVLAPSEEPPILKIGITGHQKRDGADWAWVAQELARIIAAHKLPIEGWTSLAAGADQAFARAILDRGGALVAVIPIVEYERFFERAEDVQEYRRLLDASRRIIQLDDPDPGGAFFCAGRRIVEECSSLIAVWDGEPSKGHGGTADIVAYARTRGEAILVINPISRSIRAIDG